MSSSSTPKPATVKTSVNITRAVTVPNPLRLALYKKAPELGPNVLFFSGGTALKPLSQKLIDYTHNSVHVITPFDSGGSSAKIREAFKMLAVGDLRNRLMALADRSVKGNPQIFELFAYRLPKDESQEALRARLKAMIDGEDRLIGAVPDPMRKIIRSHLGFFQDQMPEDFDLRGASIGNLILAGGFFNYNRHIDPVIFLFSKLVEARGTVRPVISKDLHLCAELEDGEVIIGQHNITGKETAPLSQPIKRVFISNSPTQANEIDVQARNKLTKRIRKADVIVYPIGSFYSSVIANILLKGIGSAVADTACPKVYIPNSVPDPEQVGMSLFSSVKTLLDYLQKSCGDETPREKLLNFVLIDSKNGNYPKPLELNKIERFGVEVIDVELISEVTAPYLDETRVIECLLSLV